MFRKGYGQMVNLILEHGGKSILRDVNKRGLTALGEAVVAGHADIASQLIKVTPHVLILMQSVLQKAQIWVELKIRLQPVVQMH